MTEYQYGRELRIISFEDKDGSYAKLLIKLRHEGLTRAEFYRTVTRGFIQDDELLDEFILEYKKKKDTFRKARQKILNNERKEAGELVSQFRLDPDEIQDIFDILEEEMGL